MLKFIMLLLITLTHTKLFAINNDDYLFHLTNQDNIIALNINLNPGEYIFWKHSGQAGHATSIKCSFSSNVKKYNILWPFPKEKIDQNNDIIYYYDNYVSIPINLSISDFTKDTTLSLDLEYVVCGNNQCIPMQQNITKTLSITKELDNSEEIKNGLTVKDIEINDKQAIFSIEFDQDLNSLPHFMVEPSKKVFIDHYKLIAESNKRYIWVTNLLPTSKEYLNQSFNLYNDITDDVTTFVFADKTKYSETNESLIYILALSILAGIILNFMPCVLPVLSLKILSILNHKENSQGIVANICGILASFASMSLISIALKNIGATFGFGMHFQEPYFIIFLIMVITIFICITLDKAVINLPNSIIEYLDGIKSGSNFIKNFLSGVLSSLLSTPCTAPFLGTVMLVALMGSNIVNMAVFLCVGIGFASPYILILIAPRLLNYIPKPGAWTIKLKQFLALLLIVTLIWLLHIIYVQLGTKATVVVAMLVVLLKFILENNDSIFKNLKVKALCFSILIICFFTLPHIAFEQRVASVEEQKGAWVKFDDSILQNAINNNRLIFVDVSADWCLTCKFNKFILLERAAFLHLMQQNNVLLIKADYTREDEAIQKFLMKNKAVGIPFNIIYGPGAQDGIALPVVLTYTHIQDALHKAKG